MHDVLKSKRATKDYETGMCYLWYATKITEILTVLQNNPLENTPGHYLERLTGRLKGAYSRRINFYHRVVYIMLPNTENTRDDYGNLYEGIVLILRAWRHDYDSIVLPKNSQ